MKVVHLVIGGDIAGGQLVALQLIRAARARGDEAVVVSPTPGPFIDLVRDAGVPVVFLDLSRTFHLRDAWTLRRLLKRERANILHTHTSLGANILARIAGRLAGVPVVAHLHIENYFRDQSLIRAVHRTLDNATARLCARIVVVSEDTRRALVRQGYPEALMETVPNGTELPPLSPHANGLREALGIPRDAKLLGSVGRLCAVKGQRELIRALPALHAEQPVWLILVGEDLEHGGGYKASLEQEATELGVRDRVLLTGYRSDVPALLDELDLFVLASTTEGMPLVVLEAMAHAKPVVATAVGGTPEVVVDGVTGRLIPAGDEDALAAALSELLADPGRAKTMGEAGRTRVVASFSVDAMTARVLAIYDSILKAARA